MMKGKAVKMNENGRFFTEFSRIFRGYFASSYAQLSPVDKAAGFLAADILAQFAADLKTGTPKSVVGSDSKRAAKKAMNGEAKSEEKRFVESPADVAIGCDWARIETAMDAVGISFSTFASFFGGEARDALELKKKLAEKKRRIAKARMQGAVAKESDGHAAWAKRLEECVFGKSKGEARRSGKPSGNKDAQMRISTQRIVAELRERGFLDIGEKEGDDYGKRHEQRGAGRAAD